MKSEIEQFVIDKVKQFRVSKGFSQSDLADLLDVTPGFIGQVESPKYDAKYNLNHINSFSQIFNCKPSDFLPDEPLRKE